MLFGNGGHGIDPKLHKYKADCTSNIAVIALEVDNLLLRPGGVSHLLQEAMYPPG